MVPDNTEGVHSEMNVPLGLKVILKVVQCGFQVLTKEAATSEKMWPLHIGQTENIIICLTRIIRGN